MIKLMIVDDEPLVQLGIKFMLNWDELDIQICGVAHNGKEALDLIAKNMPDIVITDIKMPVMDGLELISKCKRIYENSPVFIIITNHEDFNLVQQALRIEAMDYVIKIELNEDVLKNCIEKAIKQVKKNDHAQHPDNFVDKDLFTDKFLVRLLNMFYGTNEQILQQLKELSIPLEGKNYCVTFSKIDFSTSTTGNDQIQLYNYILHMMEEIISRQLSVFTVPIDKYSFSLIIRTNHSETKQAFDTILSSIKKATQMTSKYFNVNVCSGIGNVYNELLHISYSYQESLQALKHLPEDQQVVSYKDIENTILYKNTFNISVFSETLIRAFDEYNVEEAESVLNEILLLLKDHTSRYLQAFDACSNILHLLLTTLDCGEEILENIFHDDLDSYKCIYNKNTIPALISWLEKLKNGLVSELNKRKQSHTNYLVLHVEQYIQKNYTKKISLQEVAFKFNISPNYLSSIFKKHNGLGFSDYVAHIKIQHAQTMLKEGTMKIYEISHSLGFENSYYFSKVFKKIIGCSPRQYLNQSIK